LGEIFAACTAQPGAAAASGGLPIHEDLRVDPVSPPERGGVLRIYEWRDYLDHGVVEGFVRRHADLDIDVRIESFTSMPEAVARLQQPDASYDVFFPVIDALPGLVDARLLRPLSHEALPHLGNLWPFFVDPAGPFYDVGQRYTVPYTVYSTGVSWRRDLLGSTESPDRLADPSDAFWADGLDGEVGLVDDYREVLAMALLRRGADPNAADAQELRGAADDLIAMARSADVEVSTDGAYEGLQTGEYAIQQAWSGDVLAAKRFGPGDDSTQELTGYTWPTGGVVGCDLTAICAKGRNPVLAHAFVDYLLEEQVALDNFAWNGYQPPVATAVPDAFADPSFPWAGVVPAHLRSAVLAPEDLERGRFLRPLSASDDVTWRDAWWRFLVVLGGS
jgi:spermidine/putrescine transport system substrate-binding protein